jgi:hypothetical protein
MSWLIGGFVALGFTPCARAKTGIIKIATDKIVILTLMTKTLPSTGRVAAQDSAAVLGG